jgi:hypothetical protein
LTFADLLAVSPQARRCLLRLIGVGAAGSRISAAQIVNNYATTQSAAAKRKRGSCSAGPARSSALLLVRLVV